MALRASVVIASEGRESLPRAVASVLESGGAEVDVLVVFRSNARTGERAELSRDDARLRILEIPGASSTRATNWAIEQARAEIILLTDDDCSVHSGWVPALLKAIATDSNIALSFGGVEPARHDAARFFAPRHAVRETRVARTVREKAQVEGVWACFGLRRAVWEELGGFDESLGAGAIFPGAADSDFAIRALANGYSICETPDAVVTTHRLVPLEHARPTVDGYVYANAAMIAKHLKLRTAGTWRLLATLVRRGLRGRGHAVLGPTDRRPLSRALTFARGFGAGLRTPVDRETGCFAPVEAHTVPPPRRRG